jgi:hypothetical protein
VNAALRVQLHELYGIASDLDARLRKLALTPAEIGVVRAALERERE